MKNIVAGLGILLLTIIMIFSLVALNINANEKNNLEQSTKLAVYQTLNECKSPQLWPIIQSKYSLKQDDAILVKRFEENLKGLMKSSANRKIFYKIITADLDTGILSVEVKNTYSNLGLAKSIKVRKTVIFDEQK